MVAQFADDVRTYLHVALFKQPFEVHLAVGGHVAALVFEVAFYGIAGLGCRHVVNPVGVG